MKRFSIDARGQQSTGLILVQGNGAPQNPDEVTDQYMLQGARSVQRTQWDSEAGNEGDLTMNLGRDVWTVDGGRGDVSEAIKSASTKRQPETFSTGSEEQRTTEVRHFAASRASPARLPGPRPVRQIESLLIGGLVKSCPSSIVALNKYALQTAKRLWVSLRPNVGG